MENPLLVAISALAWIIEDPELNDQSMRKIAHKALKEIMELLEGA